MLCESIVRDKGEMLLLARRTSIGDRFRGVATPLSCFQGERGFLILDQGLILVYILVAHGTKSHSPVVAPPRRVFSSLGLRGPGAPFSSQDRHGSKRQESEMGRERMDEGSEIAMFFLFWDFLFFFSVVLIFSIFSSSYPLSLSQTFSFSLFFCC